MESMDWTQLGVGGMLVVLILSQVFNFLKTRNGHARSPATKQDLGVLATRDDIQIIAAGLKDHERREETELRAIVHNLTVQTETLKTMNRVLEQELRGGKR